MIREYNEKDFNIINILGRELTPNYIFKLTTVGKCFVYESDGDVLGFIILDTYSDRAEIIDVVVHINHRNKGIGSKLLECGIEKCVDNKCKSITLEVKCNNVCAVNLYKKSGFKVISTRKKYYENGTIDAYLMYREL